MLFIVLFLENYINIKKYDPGGEFMLKKLATIFVAIILMVIGSAILVYGQDVSTSTYDIKITMNEDSISVTESLTVGATSAETLIFWIQDGATDIEILINGSDIAYEQTLGENTYQCNVSELDITADTSIQVTYKLDKDTDGFEKTLQYNITSISITFDEIEIYTSSNLASGNSFNVALQKPTQVQTRTETEIKENVPSWYYAILVILIILVALSFIFPSKKSKTQKSTTKKQVKGSESEELLATKKALLMEVLKDIEKKHRAKKISDDTYNKLKDQYKQDTVEAMKQLEDLKS